jgi:hypothetical protein
MPSKERRIEIGTVEVDLPLTWSLTKFEPDDDLSLNTMVDTWIREQLGEIHPVYSYYPIIALVKAEWTVDTCDKYDGTYDLTGTMHVVVDYFPEGRRWNEQTIIKKVKDIIVLLLTPCSGKLTVGYVGESSTT